MTVFVDTSAVYALLDADDANFRRAERSWNELLLGQEKMITSNYVALELCALLQNRLGLGAVRDFQESVQPLLSVHWIDGDLHQSGVSAMLAAGKRDLSLVDCTSFEIMRRLGVRKVFTFDTHFRKQGFECLPKRS